MPSKPVNNTPTWQDDCLVFVVIFVSVTPLVSTAPRLLVLGGVVAFLLTRPRRRLPPGTLLMIYAGMSVGVVQDLIPGPSLSLEGLGLHAYFIASVTVAWLLAAYAPLAHFLESLRRVVICLAVASLVGVLIYYLQPGLITAFPQYSYYDTQHRTMFVTNFLIADDGRVIQRNSGIASEPGLFQLVLNLGAAALVRQRLLTSADLVQLCILGLAIFTTQSTAGLAIFVVMSLFAAARSGKVLVALLIAGVGFSGTLYTQYTNQQNKLLNTVALEQRAGPAQEITQQLWLNPFGVGNNEYSLVYEERHWGSFDSYTQILIRYGIPLFLILVAILIRLTLSHPILGVVIALTLLSQPVWFVPVVSFFYFARFFTPARVRQGHPAGSIEAS